jgi:hypothetical protein
MVLLGLVFAAVLGYSMHTGVPEPPSMKAICPTSNPALERFCWHLDHAASIYALIFKSRCPDREGTDIVFRSSIEEAMKCRRELLKETDGSYSDVRIVRVTPIAERNE